MDQTRFDLFTRSLAVTHSRRQVLKGLFAGSAVGAGLATGFTLDVQPASAQECTPDDSACSADTECCSGSCDDSGYCYTPDTTCIEDGGLCQAGRYCCSGLDCAPGGHCPAAQCIADGDLCQAGVYCCSGLDCAPGGHCPVSECVDDGGDCTADTDCCSGSCGDDGACYTPENTCIEDGGLCQAGLYCCSGLDCAPGGHCPNSTVSTLPATGAGPGNTSDSTSNLITPVAAIAAAAMVVGIRRLRADEQHDINA